MAWKTNEDKWLGSRLVKHFVSPVPGRMLLLPLILVSLTTWLLYTLQSVLGRVEGRSLRPFDIGYLIPILFLTVLRGRSIGVLTLLLSAVASAYVLSEPFFSIHMFHARDRAEMLMLLLVGATVVVVAGAFHGVLRDMSVALASAQMEIQIRATVAEAEGVRRLRSCAVGRRGLDYHVALEISAYPSLSAPAAVLLADQVEAAVRSLDPFIAQVEVRVTA